MIPRVCYPDLVEANVTINTRERSSHVDGNVSEFELDVINRLVSYHEPSTVFEIGTFDGRTTLNLAAHAAAGAKVLTLDLPPSEVDQTALHIEDGDRMFINKPVSGAHFADSEFAAQIEQLYGDSGVFDFTPYYGKVDFLFVDGSHSYDYVLKDSETALRIVKPGGLIIWHDYLPHGPTAWPGVTRGLEELFEMDPRFSGMKHIAATSIVMMQVPGSSTGRAAKPALQYGVFGDSRQPECLTAALTVELERSLVLVGEVFRFRAHAVNTGRATWLPSQAPVGPVRLGSRLFDEHGNLIDISYSRHHLPGTQPFVQGAEVTFEGDLPSPSPGSYFVEFDMVSEGVVWFTRNGATPVRVAIEVQ